MHIIHLRAHHLLCSVLYKGKGYNKAFTRQMTTIVDALKKADTMVILDVRPDDICSHCPNKKADGTCRLDEEKSTFSGGIQQTETEIRNLDSRILEYFHFSGNIPLAKTDVYQTIKEQLSEDFFNTCCQNCRWKKQGLCSYREYMTQIDAFID